MLQNINGLENARNLLANLSALLHLNDYHRTGDVKWGHEKGHLKNTFVVKSVFVSGIHSIKLTY